MERIGFGAKSFGFRTFGFGSEVVPEPVWTPLDLFKGGKQGVWYDPSDLSTMFQDAAGTVPVTANGDPVALMRDKSGNNNHATQTVSAARPTYQTDGFLHWLNFDGVDDSLAIAVVPLGGNVQSAYIGITKIRDTKTSFVLDVEPINGGGGGLVVFAPSNGGTYQYNVRSGTDTLGVYTEDIKFKAPNTAVIYGELSSKLYMRLNKDARLSEVVDSPITAETFKVNLGAGRLNDLCLEGRMYCMILINDSMDGKDVVTDYLAVKSGVTL